MYPLTRLLAVMWRASRAPGLSLEAQSETGFICRPWDIDMFGEMNNGRVLTLYDLGRFDLVIRTGFWQAMREQRWGLVVAGASVRYRKRVRMFNRVRMRTRIAGVDDRWIYIVQSMWVRGQPTSSILLRTGVTARGKVVDTREVLAAAGSENWNQPLPDWIKAWIAAEEKRGWPP